MQDLENIKQCIHSPDPSNRSLGFMLDQSQNGGAYKKELELKYKPILDIKGCSVEELLGMTELDVSGEGLTSLDLTGLVGLESLYCNNNPNIKVIGKK